MNLAGEYSARSCTISMLIQCIARHSDIRNVIFSISLANWRDVSLTHEFPRSIFGIFFKFGSELAGDLPKVVAPITPNASTSIQHIEDEQFINSKAASHPTSSCRPVIRR